MAEQPYGPTDAGAVVLDIGGDVGALVLHTTPELVGAEIEVSRVGAGTPRTHTAVRQRRDGPSVQYAAIFAALHAGDYVVHDLDGTPTDTVTIIGGHVATLDWSQH
ncbi:hypothetical protein [Allobranchiibius sp. GilTou38]|uniref:hypothetical protein n=1 Tax=Allobranchiibius sp. GilTou38 TaxID=2815210 RepID=UPI001AA16963|nr:hypothetical protein [Allobranchiibius sp. GilTou38]MBO1766768.1 hypothetical protein [Allobranchiibius sp. GilTou38]